MSQVLRAGERRREGESAKVGATVSLRPEVWSPEQGATGK